MKKNVFLLLLILYPVISSLGQIKLENAFPNLDFLQPLDLQIPSDGSNRVFVVTQEGVIYVFPNNKDAAEKKVFLNIKEQIVSGGELGLLGLVFHPDFKRNGYFYINYTAPLPLRTEIVRYKVNRNFPDLADTSSKVVILTFNQPYVNHNAGQLAFGPDGYLYIGTGDGGSGGDPQNNGQNKASLLGKMLRIDVNHSQGIQHYSIPQDNPFAGNRQGFKEEIFAWGFRNPWRYSLDPVTGKFWVADVGQDKWEEIDILEKGKNYGWRIMEGLHCYNPEVNCDQSGLTMPVWEYGHNETGGNSITGGFVYRGKSFPELDGKYIYSDFVSGRIWALTYKGQGMVSNELILNSGKNISSFGIDRNNELFICSFDGRIYRLAKSVSTILPGEKPKEYNIFFNYPNPLNSSTTIIADIKEPGKINIEVFNIEGEKITDIYSGNVEAGRYTYFWDGSGFPPGVYIYRLTAGKFSLAKKMALLK
jgi:glucose/arabinose dehydrogenase